AGVLYASISYSNLTGYLLDAYFPPETMPGYRDMKAQTFNTEELTEYERFSELILNAGSTKILLSASAPVYDVKIMDYSSFGHSIKQVMYAAYALSPNDAILLEADFENTKLVISYRNANGTQACLIHVDGDTVTLEPI
ncbi:MAG: hypothetical protein J6Q54_00805, partial [Oscillospiraceae bacterium]|nr:hypothetical protein [Oscillospiraceae bacterium]